MSLRHSPPPASSAPPAQRPVPSATCDSDTPSERSGNDKICLRPKRRREDDDIRELKLLISSLSDKVDKRFNEVEQQINGIQQQNNDLKYSLEFLTNKYDTVIEKIKQLEEDKIKEKSYVLTLENKIESLERKMKSRGLEIRNVPILSADPKGIETKEEMCAVIQTLAHSLGEVILESDITDIYRTNSKNNSSKPIIVELNSVLKKNKLLQAVKMFNKNKPKDDKLNTGTLKISGPTKPIYVSETLSFKTQKLFHVAREFAKDYSYQFCWTTKGQIYLRRNETQPVLRVESEDTIYNLKNNS